MSCKNPLIGYVYGINPDTGKKKIRIINNNIEYFENKNKINQKNEIEKFNDKNRILIPCGQCIDCRLQYSRQWANRLMLEKKYSSSAYFITLTYDDEHMPLVHYGEKSDEVAGTLCKRDWQLFMKRLRKRFPDVHLSFFMCGEYGEKNHRPHMHAIIFNLPLDDVRQTGISELGYPYYWSNTICKAWSSYHKIAQVSYPEWLDKPVNHSQKKFWLEDKEYGYYTPYGLIQVCEVDWSCCAYVARYVTKKLTGDYKKFYETFKLVPEFCLMSRKPAIGRQYYENHKDELFEYDYINIGATRQGLKFKPPRYYKYLYELESPEDMEKIKENSSRVGKEFSKLKLQHTDLSYFELLAVEEQELQNKIKSMERKL